jgi:signal transduction histidine kinase
MPDPPDTLRSRGMGHAGYRPLAGGSPTAKPLPGLLPARLRLSARAVDAWFAAGLTLLMLGTAAALTKGSSGRGVLAHLAIVLVSGVAIAWRRRAPRSVLGFEIAAVLVEGASGLPQDVGIGVVVACYTLASVSSWRTTTAAGAVAAAALGVSRLGYGGRTLAVLVSATLAVAAACVLGLYIGTRRAYVEQLADRAERLEREHQLLAERIVSDERARIARELHDVVAHHVSLMVVQGAAVGETLGASHPLAPTLDALAGTGRQALGELRRLLGLLRAEHEVEHAPQPGLAELAALAEQVEASGLHVEIVRTGDATPLPPGIELSAYRIVQEALTNAMRHGQARTATVTVGIAAATLELSIVDDGRGGSAPATSGGHGLVGMRERVALYDGSLEVGPSPTGGYVVRASLPIAGAS